MKIIDPFLLSQSSNWFSLAIKVAVKYSVVLSYLNIFLIVLKICLNVEPYFSIYGFYADQINYEFQIAKPQVF